MIFRIWALPRGWLGQIQELVSNWANFCRHRWFAPTSEFIGVVSWDFQGLTNSQCFDQNFVHFRSKKLSHNISNCVSNCDKIHQNIPLAGDSSILTMWACGLHLTQEFLTLPERNMHFGWFLGVFRTKIPPKLSQKLPQPYIWGFLNSPKLRFGRFDPTFRE